MEPKDTRDRILDVAFDLFARRSYSKVSMDDIAREAGVSKGGLFHHFPSKYILGRECLVRWLGSMTGDLTDPSYRKRTTPAERIGSLLDISLTLPETEVQYFRFFMELYNESFDDPAEKAFWKGFIHEYVETIATDMESIGSEDPRTKALLMLAMLDGLGLYQTMVRDEPWVDRNAIRRELERMFLGG